MSIVIGPGAAGDLSELGGKAGALARLTAAGFPVPAWFVVTPRAFALSAANGGARALADVSPAPEVVGELRDALQRLGDESALYAVRSSAVAEDSAQHSFAGQLESYLFVPARDVPRRVADVWRSAFSERVAAYRREHGLSGVPDAPAVLVQRMVDAEVSGVAFSADPVSGDRQVAVVGSLYGLGTALVSGDAEADTHRVDARDRIVARSLAQKVTAHRAAPGSATGVVVAAVDPALAGAPALRDEQIAAVAALARRAERFFARPQDIEWAIARGELFLLQSRPITALAPPAEAPGALAIWDNSNIAENYGGVTTPLTFTFARNAYAGVFRLLCRNFGVPRPRIEANRDALENMIGLVRGRIYYNLANWYRLLATLPGYRMNRAFLEQMIGVRESAPEGLPGTEAPAGRLARAVDAVRFGRAALGIAAGYFTLPRRTQHFYRRVDEAIATGDLSAHGAAQLVAEYRRMEDRLLVRWDAPQINDFFAMVFYGVLRRLCVRWCADADGTLQNGLLSGTGGMVSTEPADRVEEMAALARRHPVLADALRTADAERVLAVMSQHPDFAALYRGYLDRFGDRCTDELKLESLTLHEKPLLLMRSIGFLAQRPEGARGLGDRAGLRADSERRARAALGPNPLRRAVFAWVLGNARRFVRGRENMRLQRTRVFARSRAIFTALGRRLHEDGRIDHPRDVFYLELNEVLATGGETAAATDLRGAVAARKEEFARYAAMGAPPDRFETRGSPDPDVALRRAEATGVEAGDRRTGTGCCPGIVAGPVRVVLDPSAATLRHGDILVAERTDPSWVMLFPFARGLLVERGNLLSHSAIVAREMGIPAVVSIPGLTQWLQDGDWVELDGTTGVVHRTARAQ